MSITEMSFTNRRQLSVPESIQEIMRIMHCNYGGI